MTKQLEKPIRGLKPDKKYDFSHIGKVIEALDKLRQDAEHTGDEDMALLISSTFNICFTAYHTALRMRIMQGSSNMTIS